MKKQTILSVILATLVVLQLASLASAITIRDVSVSPETVEPGKIATIQMTLENNFDKQVDNVQVSVDLTDVPLAPQSSSAVFVEKIKHDKTESFSFDIQVNSDAEAGVYKFPVLVKYDLENKTIQESSQVSITVNAKPVLELNAEGVLIAGQKGTLTIKITNLGLAKARFLQASVSSSGNYQILSPSNNYIGDLNSNDFDSISVSIYSKNSGTITIPVELIYKDFANNDYKESGQVSIKIYSMEDALSLGLVQKNNTGTYVAVVVVLVVLWIVYSRLRKWMKKRKANRMNGGK
jgi:hypothetical protein